MILRQVGPKQKMHFCYLGIIGGKNGQRGGNDNTYTDGHRRHTNRRTEEGAPTSHTTAVQIRTSAKRSTMSVEVYFKKDITQILTGVVTGMCKVAVEGHVNTEYMRGVMDLALALCKAFGIATPEQDC